MKELELKTKIILYENIDELNEKEGKLLSEAKSATDKSHAPYSSFHVGCAILLANGEIISGANQENAAYPACICAERVTISAMSAQYPNVKPEMMAIACRSLKKDEIQPAAPCGECRQTIYEYEKRFNTTIPILLSGTGESVYRIESVKDILPLGFDEDSF